MGLDVMGLMSLLQGGSSMMGQAGNMRSQGLSQLDTIMDMVRYAQRNRDPLFNQVRDYSVNQFNESPYGPFGDVGGSFGGMWGTKSDGSPVQYGDMAANQYNYMLNNNPGTQALATLNGLSDQIWGSGGGSSGVKSAAPSSPVMGTAVSGLGPATSGTQLSGVGASSGTNTLPLPSDSGGILGGGGGGGGNGGSIMNAIKEQIARRISGGGSGSGSGSGSLSSMLEPGDRLNIARNLMTPGNPYPTSFNGQTAAGNFSSLFGKQGAGSVQQTPANYAEVPTWVANSNARTQPNTSTPGREHLATVLQSMMSKRRAA